MLAARGWLRVDVSHDFRSPWSFFPDKIKRKDSLVRSSTPTLSASAFMNSSFFEELKWRGLVHDVSEGAETLGRDKPISAYIGFDPTAGSLHVGNLVQILLLHHLAHHGHHPVVLLGGGTAMVGDPSGKDTERSLLDKDHVIENAKRLKKQIRDLVISDKETKLLYVDNSDWLGRLNFLDFIRDAGKHMNISRMIAKDSVRNRLDEGISFAEFSYQILQAYDYYHLHRNHQVSLQLGGSDQWGNITAGIHLVRRLSGHQVYGITSPLIVRSDGSKFGKSVEGNVWLDGSKTSPYKFYQYWTNLSDQEAEGCLKIFTRIPREDCQEQIINHRKAPHQRSLQKTLASILTELVHGKKLSDRVQNTSRILFGQQGGLLESLDEESLTQCLEDVPLISISHSQWEGAEDLTTLLSHTTRNVLFPSKGEAKRTIQGGGLHVNERKITPATEKGDLKWLFDRYLVVRKGKKKYHLIRKGP